jgi:quercetin dioxygenase-like cupin family protein
MRSHDVRYIIGEQRNRGAGWRTVLSEEKSRVLLDNHRVRVLELRLPPGESEPMHSHPDYLVYVLSPATVRMTAADGSTKFVELRAGEVSFGSPTTHSGENVGGTTLHELIIELK